MDTIEKRKQMSKIHRTDEYQKKSNLLYSKFWSWGQRKVSVRTEYEIADLQELSIQAYKLAKFLEDKIATPKTNNLNLFDDNCSLNKHDVKVWKATGYTIKDKAPIMRGECSRCLADVVNYDNKKIA